MYPDDGPCAMVAVRTHPLLHGVGSVFSHRPARRMTPVPQRIGYARTNPTRTPARRRHHEALVNPSTRSGTSSVFALGAASCRFDRMSSLSCENRAQLDQHSKPVPNDLALDDLSICDAEVVDKE